MPSTTPGPRVAAVVEDAEFLAEHHVPMQDAARRLGYKDEKALERTLARARRYDIVSRFRGTKTVAV